MKIERPTFPEEPLRRVLQEPKPAVVNRDGDELGFRQEKDGQLYFWDNILEFSDSWTKPNRQIPLFTLPSFTKKTVGEDEDEQLKLPQGKSPGIPRDYVQQNQEFWRNAKRGIVSKPLELTRTAGIIHDRMVKTFSLGDVQEPILSWSALFDRSKSAKFVYREKIPDGVSKEDAPDFTVGTARITEYATNRATRLFIERNMDLPFLRDLGGAYARIADLLTYEILINGTYRRMAQIESVAGQNGKNYNQAIEEALFRHDFEPINALIADTTEYSGWRNITDLAIEIGKKKFKKPDLAKWMDKLEIEDDNNRIKRGAKSVIASVAAGGVFRSPGVTEVSGGMMGFLIGETGLIYALNLGGYVAQHPESLNSILPIVAENLGLAVFPVIAITPALGIHEIIHSYSSNEQFYGLIPATLIEKETVPYLARLEPSKE